MGNQQQRAGLASLGTNLAQGLWGGMLGDDLWSALVLAPVMEGASPAGDRSGQEPTQQASQMKSGKPRLPGLRPGWKQWPQDTVGPEL